MLLSGRVAKQGEKAGLFAAVVRVSATGDNVSVMSDHAIGVKEGDQVLVLGSVVEDPRSYVDGYHGSQPRIIWAGTAVKLQGK